MATDPYFGRLVHRARDTSTSLDTPNATYYRSSSITKCRCHRARDRQSKTPESPPRYQASVVDIIGCDPSVNVALTR